MRKSLNDNFRKFVDMRILKSVFILCLHLVTLISFGQSNSLVFPKNGQTLSSNFTIDWNSNEQSDQYNLRIATDPNFNTIVADYYQAPSSKLFQININDILYWKVYYLNSSIVIDSSDISMFSVFAPSDLDSLNLWVKADSNVVISNGTISQWGDLSDSLSDLLQSSVTRQPVIVNNGINNLPVIDFDAVNDRLQTTVDLSKKNFSISSVYSSKVQSSGIRMVNGTTNWIYGPFSGVHRVFNGGFVGGKAVVANKFVIHTAVSRNDTLNNYVNSIYYGQRKNSYSPGILTVGDNPINGQVAEMVIVNGELLEANRVVLDNYLMDKYAPPINLGKDMDICSLPIQLSAYKDSYSGYIWSNGSTDSIISISSSGKYYVTVTDIFDRVSVDSVIIQQDTVNFVVDLGSDTVICQGQNIRLEAGNHLYSYQWNVNSNESTITIDTTFNYKVTVADCKGNISIDSVLVTVSDPAFNLGADTSICFSDSLIVNPSRMFSGASYLWSTGSIASSISVFVRNNYALTVTDQFTCVFFDTLFVNSDSTIYNINIGNDTSLCNGNQVGLIPPLANIDGYLWSTNSVDSFITVNTTQKYYVTVSKRGCMNTDSISITIKGDAPISDFNFTGQCNQGTTLFVDNSTDPQGINIKTYNWSFGDSSFAPLKDPAHYYTLPGIYDVTLNVTNDSNCSGTSKKNVEIYSKPTSSFTNQLSCEIDSTFFMNTSVVLTDTISNYHWNFGVGGILSDTSSLVNASFIFPQDSTHFVRLEVETINGCKDTLSKVIFVNAKPEVSFSFLGTIIGDSTKFTNTSTIGKGVISTYTWNLGNGLTTMDINPKNLYANKGVYFIQLDALSDSGCFEIFTDSIKIIDPPPTFKTIFPKNNQSLSADVDFVWNTTDSANNYILELAQDSAFTIVIMSQNVIGQQLLVSNTYPFGKYYWRVKSLRNSVTIDTTNISAFQFFNPSAIDSLNLWIKADEGIVDVNNKIQSWFDLSDSSIILTQLDSSKRPVIQNNALNGFPVVSFDNVNDQLTTPLNIVGRDFLISSVYNTKEQNRGISFIRGASNWIFGPFSGFYRVFNGGFLLGKPVEPFKYVLQTAASVDDTTSNYVNSQLFGSRKNSFSPGLLTIGANAINGNVAEIIIVNGKSSDAERESIDNYLLDKYAPPVNLGADIKVCSFPDSIKLSMDYVESFLWSNGDTASSLVVVKEGKYLVTVTDIFDRESIDSVYFILDTANFELNFPYHDTTICLGDKIEVTAGPNNYSYNWSTGETSSKIELSRNFNYVVTVTGCRGQVAMDSINLIINSPSFDLGADTTICHNEIIVIQPDSVFSNVNYLWSTGELSNLILADTTNSYYLTIEDQYSCSFSDTIRVTIDSSMFDLTLGEDTTLCAGNVINLINPNTSISSYLWSTGSINSTTLVDTMGAYKLQVSNGRCQVSDTINILIKGKAPVADFEFQNLCFGDSLSFVDSSKVAVINDTIINWNWHFGNGDSQLLQNPRYRYVQRGRYSVLLEIETDKGCFDSISKLVEINPLPIANFNIQQSIVCAKSRVFHQDSSFISGGLISDYDWNFGDILNNQNTSTAKNPFHTFDTVGNYNILLKVTSNLGCFDSVQKTLFVNSSPIPNYTIDGFCIGDSITLSEQVAYAGLDSIEYFWTIRALGGNFTTDRRMNPKLKFINSGDYDIGLRARNTIGIFEWCEASFKDTITLFDSPMADFVIPEICENDSFEISNFSMPIADILKYRYILNQTDTFNISNPKISGKLPGKYPLGLLISDVNSCKDSIVKQLEISQKPKIQFTILNNNSGVPFNIDLQNRSLSSSSYLWKFGTGDTSPDEEPNYVYSDTGTFQITLIGSTPSGCIDSTSENAFALSKFIDASLTKLFLTENTLGDIEVSFQILNSGFNTINNLLMSVDLNNEFEFREFFSTNLYSGRSDGFRMDATFIPNAGRKIDYVCVRIFAVNGISDSIVLNNELCELGFNDELSITLYPNPVEDLLSFQYTLPDDGVAQIQFFDALGRERKNGFSKQQEEGFYSTVINLVDFTRGIYYYRFIFNGNVKTGKFMVK